MCSGTCPSWSFQSADDATAEKPAFGSPTPRASSPHSRMGRVASLLVLYQFLKRPPLLGSQKHRDLPQSHCWSKQNRLKADGKKKQKACP